MRYAIFSDIHNHTAALTAVLNHAQTQGVDGYYCLGDMGVDDCAELVQQVEAATVFGNWEVSNWRVLRPENRTWALKLPPMRKEKRYWLTHAAPFWPAKLATLADLNANRYDMPMSRLFPYLDTESEVLWETFATLAEANVRLLFHGHTHRQTIWHFSADNRLHGLNQRTLSVRPDDTYIIGVGSVGRPQDRTGAAYAIYDDTASVVEMIRV